jgi:hypothetical protein
MPEVKETDQGLVIEARVHPALRIAFGALGVLPLLAPYQLLVRPHWSSYGSPLFLFALVVSLVAVAVGAFFLFGAVAGLATRMSFAPATRTFTHVTAAPAFPRRRRSASFGQVREVAVDTQAWSDGPATFSLRVVLDDGAACVIGPFDDVSATEALAARIRTVVAGK